LRYIEEERRRLDEAKRQYELNLATTNNNMEEERRRLEEVKRQHEQYLSTLHKDDEVNRRKKEEDLRYIEEERRRLEETRRQYELNLVTTNNNMEEERRRLEETRRQYELNLSTTNTTVNMQYVTSNQVQPPVNTGYSGQDYMNTGYPPNYMTVAYPPGPGLEMNTGYNPNPPLGPGLGLEINTGYPTVPPGSDMSSYYYQQQTYVNTGYNQPNPAYGFDQYQQTNVQQTYYPPYTNTYVYQQPIHQVYHTGYDVSYKKYKHKKWKQNKWKW